MDNYYQFHDLEDMKKLPGLSIPDYRELNRRFLEAVHEPANKIYRTNLPFSGRTPSAIPMKW